METSFRGFLFRGFLMSRGLANRFRNAQAWEIRACLCAHRGRGQDTDHKGEVSSGPTAWASLFRRRTP